VAAAIRRLNMTRIIVAHRPETVAAADRVVRLDAGRIVAAARTAAPRTASPATGLESDATQLTLPKLALGTPSAVEQELLGNLGC
jgi:energy-coupling factor transporter ATP-binding protein EcfA2